MSSHAQSLPPPTVVSHPTGFLAFAADTNTASCRCFRVSSLCCVRRRHCFFSLILVGCLILELHVGQVIVRRVSQLARCGPDLRFLAYGSTLYKSLAASALRWWSNVEEEGALRDCVVFGGGTLSSGLWYALRLAVQRAKGGEILAAKSSCIIFFFFRPWDELVVLYIYIFFFMRALVVSHVLHYLGLDLCVCLRRFSSFFVCVHVCAPFVQH